jgi:hypothetical protein
MTKKQLRNLAERIAANERIIQANADPSAVTKAQDAIISLSSQLDIMDLLALDDLLQEMLKK